MTTKHHFILSGIMALTIVACGNKSSIQKYGPGPVGSTTPLIETQVETKAQCLLTQAKINPQEHQASYSVSLQRETILKVLEEIKADLEYRPADFWAALSPDVRDTLNYELNLQLQRTKAVDPLAVYQSVAFFFSRVRDNFDEKKEYRVKDSKDRVYAVKVKGLDKTDPYLFTCGQSETWDLGAYSVAPEVAMISDVEEIYECRTSRAALLLMKMKDRLYLSSGNSLVRLNVDSFKLERSKRESLLEYHEREGYLEIEVKFKRNAAVNGWKGKAAKLDVLFDDFQIKDKSAACISLYHAF